MEPKTTWQPRSPWCKTVASWKGRIERTMNLGLEVVLEYIGDKDNTLELENVEQLVSAEKG